jgi:hypothetical protein
MWSAWTARSPTPRRSRACRVVDGPVPCSVVNHGASIAPRRPSGVLELTRPASPAASAARCLRYMTSRAAASRGALQETPGIAEMHTSSSNAHPVSPGSLAIGQRTSPGRPGPRQSRLQQRCPDRALRAGRGMTGSGSGRPRRRAAIGVGQGRAGGQQQPDDLELEFAGAGGPARAGGCDRQVKRGGAPPSWSPRSRPGRRRAPPRRWFHGSGMHDGSAGSAQAGQHGSGRRSAVACYVHCSASPAAASGWPMDRPLAGSKNCR